MSPDRPAPAPGSMSGGERALLLFWLPVHLFLLPELLGLLLPELDEAGLNLRYYALSTGLLAPLCLPALRRDFDPLCDHFGEVLRTVLKALCWMYLGELAVNLPLSALLGGENPNNRAVEELLRSGAGSLSAAILLLAPLGEELMFRGGLFGSLRRFGFPLAAGLSALLFGLAHVWPYAFLAPGYLWYLLQYLPAGLALAWCYQRTGSIWSSILLHMLNNGLSLLAVKMGGSLT